MRKLVIAPHPDDEVLGCGGYLLKSKEKKDEVSIIMCTSLLAKEGWNSKEIELKLKQIEKVREKLGVNSKNFHSLNLPTTKLDQYPVSFLVKKISQIINVFRPEELLIPHPGDIHSDHKIVFEASITTTKWFRYPFIKRVLTYETISETNFGLDPRYLTFNPNTFVDISKHLNEKLETMKIYENEIGVFPFPRSLDAISAQALSRGTQAGFKAAEAFSLLKDIID